MLYQQTTNAKKFVESLDELEHVTKVTQKEKVWFKDENGEDGYYYESIPYYEIDLTLYGDYCGDSVTRANHDWLKKETSRLNWVYSQYKGYYAYSIVIDVQNLPKRSVWFIQLLELIEGLSDYPLFDEESHSELQIAQEEEQFKEWYASDFTSDVIKHNSEYEYLIDDLEPSYGAYVQWVHNEAIELNRAHVNRFWARVATLKAEIKATKKFLQDVNTYNVHFSHIAQIAKLDGLVDELNSTMDKRPYVNDEMGYMESASSFYFNDFSQYVNDENIIKLYPEICTCGQCGMLENPNNMGTEDENICHECEQTNIEKNNASYHKDYKEGENGVLFHEGTNTYAPTLPFMN